MSTPDAIDLLPSRIASGLGLAASGTPVPSYQTLHRRGMLPGDFYSHIEKGRRLLSRQGFLALAGYRAVVGNGVEIGELPPAAFLRWAELWMRTRGSAKPVRELWVRYYGRPGDPDSKVSLLPNEDLLSEPPAPGALLTIVFNLDEIFSRAERALADLASKERETWEGLAGDE
jgi:hypothetical protein